MLVVMVIYAASLDCVYHLLIYMKSFFVLSYGIIVINSYHYHFIASYVIKAFQCSTTYFLSMYIHSFSFDIFTAVLSLELGCSNNNIHTYNLVQSRSPGSSISSYRHIYRIP